MAYLAGGDFYGSEVATTVAAPTNARIELVGADGAVTVLKAKTPLQAGEIIDASAMSRKALRAFFAEQIASAKQDGVLFSLHVKTTMMKISDPIIFGHAVSVFFADVFEKHAATLARIGVDPDNGVGDLLARIETLPDAEKAAIKADIAATYAARPGLAMVNSDRGNHQPARAERCDRRRVDAGDDPRIRPHVGRRRQAARRDRRDPGSQLRAPVSDGHRRL